MSLSRLSNVYVFPDSPEWGEHGYDDDRPEFNGEHDLLFRVLRPGDVVFDVGASKGDWSLQALDFVSSLSLYAFEPNPGAFPLLKERLAGSGAQAFNLAMSRVDEFRAFFYQSNNLKMAEMSSFYRRPEIEEKLGLDTVPISIQVRALDAFCKGQGIERINFLKVDTEGGELDVLTGARGLLERQAIDMIQVEYGGTYRDAGITLQEVHGFLRKYGYHLYRMASEGLIRLDHWHGGLENYRYSNYLAVSDSAVEEVFLQLPQYQFLNAGDLVFDVGAGSGRKTDNFLGSGASVVCVEPQPSSAKHLRSKYRHHAGVRVVELGLSDQGGILSLAISSDSADIATFSEARRAACTSGEQWHGSIPVGVSTLDALLRDHGVPRYCSIDAEGFELMVLRGLSAAIPYVSFGFSSHGLPDTHACISRLQEIGYEEFNLVWEGRDGFAFREWLDAGDLRRYFGAQRLESIRGEVYARRLVERPEVRRTDGAARPALDPSRDTLTQLIELGLWDGKGPLRLHLGCGENHLAGYVNLDHPPGAHTTQTTVAADAFADLRTLSFPPEALDEVRLHHVFEHFDRAVSLALLIRWHEGLKVGGRLHLETPDVMGCAKELLGPSSYQSKQAILRHMFGSHEATWAYHLDGWYPEKFQDVLSKLGFTVECRSWQWSYEPYLANVEAFATKQAHLSRESLLAAADTILEDGMVANVESERLMHAQWRRNLRRELGESEAVPEGEQASHAGTRETVVLVFSKDRAMQLDATLASLSRHCLDLADADCKVLYATSTAEHERQYATLQQTYPAIGFAKETDFYADLLNSLGAYRNVLFMVDDNLFVRDFFLAEAVEFLNSNEDALGFSLRLGKNVRYCYPVSAPQRQPEFQSIQPGVMKFRWLGAEHDFGYPLELSSSLFRVSDVLPILLKTAVRNPNYAEVALNDSKLDFAGRKMNLLCFERSVAFCVPLNMVQQAFTNRAGDKPEYTVDSLSAMFAADQRINIRRFDNFSPDGCHQEVELSFISGADN